MTNAERIRNMTNEELQQFLCQISSCETCAFAQYGCAVEEWLTQEDCNESYAERMAAAEVRRAAERVHRMNGDELKDQLLETDAFRGFMESLKRFADAMHDSLEAFADVIRSGRQIRD